MGLLSRVPPPLDAVRQARCFRQRDLRTAAAVRQSGCCNDHVNKPLSFLPLTPRRRSSPKYPTPPAPGRWCLASPTSPRQHHGSCSVNQAPRPKERSLSSLPCTWTEGSPRAARGTAAARASEGDGARQPHGPSHGLSERCTASLEALHAERAGPGCPPCHVHQTPRRPPSPWPSASRTHSPTRNTLPEAAKTSSRGLGGPSQHLLVLSSRSPCCQGRR